LCRRLTADRIQTGIVHRPQVLSNGCATSTPLASSRPSSSVRRHPAHGNPRTDGERYPRALSPVNGAPHRGVAWYSAGVVPSDERTAKGVRTGVLDTHGDLLSEQGGRAS